MNALEQYRTRLAAHLSMQQQLRTRERRLATARLLTFFAIVAALWLAFVEEMVSGAVILPLVALFVILIIVHDRAIATRHREERATSYFDGRLMRLENRWSGHGSDGTKYLDEHHPYAADLDIFGNGSLWQWMWMPRTEPGDRKLAAWLSAPAAEVEVGERQTAVDELAAAIDFRRNLAIAAAGGDGSFDSPELLEWCGGRASLSRAARIVSWILSVAGAASLLLAVTAFVLTIARGNDAATLPLLLRLPFGYVPLTVVIILEMLWTTAMKSRVQSVTRSLGRPHRDLSRLAEVLRRVEAETQWKAPMLRSAAAALGDPHPASKEIDRLERLVTLLDSKHNLMFAPIAALLLWETHLAFAIDGWRRRSGTAVASWIDALGTFEALATLAQIRFERTDFTFPALDRRGRIFSARQLGHPLLPADRVVRNDISIDETTRILIVSGSNMSGKSTMLRSVGINAVLAQAGAPVCAASLELSPVAVGASIRLHDSLLEGSSRFYAEILRLRQILELADAGKSGGLRLLFLLDEILSGTNSHDRRAGAQGYVRSLVARGAAGLVTTHDLALAKLADDPSLHARNVHFEDHVEDGRIAFDYRMREGVVEKSNAIELMRMVGLDV